jgi:uncharacterized protein (TIGR03083 family)
MADTGTLLTLAAAEQDDFVELTRELAPAQWVAPSLCPRWTVRETVMHVTIHTHQTLRESVKASREMLRRRDEPTETLVDSLAAPLYAKSPWELRLQLGELLIHQQDVRRPLSLAREIPADRLTAVLRTSLGRGDGLIIGVKARKHARGLTLVATDLDWSWGSGPEVRGSAEAILMAIAGRAAAVDDLSGDGVATLSARVR